MYEELQDAGVHVDRIFLQQRRAILLRLFASVLLIVAYLFLGALVFQFVQGHESTDTPEETWTYLNSVYFCATTLTTVGFGDFYPTHPADQFVNVLFILSGLLVVGTAVSTIAEGLMTLIESRIRITRKRRRERRLRQLQEGKSEAELLIDPLLLAQKIPLGIKLHDAVWNNLSIMIALSLFVFGWFVGAVGVPRPPLRDSSSRTLTVYISQSLLSSPTLLLTCFSWKDASMAYSSFSLSLSLQLFMALDCLPAAYSWAVFMYLEDLSYGDSVYLCLIILTTVGYGHIAPVTSGGRLFFIPYSFLGLGILAYLLNEVGARRQRQMESRVPEVMHTIHMMSLWRTLEEVEELLHHVKPGSPMARLAQRKVEIFQEKLEHLRYGSHIRAYIVNEDSSDGSDSEALYQEQRSTSAPEMTHTINH